MSLLSHFSFKGKQEQAATDSNPAIAVTAGAGSGKTLSLVGRYLHLLEQGYQLRSILAITFTEKAAREMRSRIRAALSDPKELTAKNAKEEIENLSDLRALRGSNIDSARISTIHSLCAEILRAHPAEAGLDPAFEVLEEGLSAALQAEAIESALAWASADEESVTLFGIEAFKENELRQILNALMSRRLDINSLYTEKQKEIHENPRTDFELALSSYLATHLDSQIWVNALSDLASHQSSSPADKLELARWNVIARWDEIQAARAAENWDMVLASLAALRKATSIMGQKNNWDDIETIRAAMSDLRNIYDEHLKFIAEKSRWSLDEKVAAHLPALYRLFDQTLHEYQRRKDEKQSLDFDDLEGLTASLLMKNPAVRARLQSELRAVLVDEFQDTNDRQRQIVYALTGFNSKSQIQNPKSVDLFIVGDSKQSIYRFRSADVTIFRQVQSDIQSAGGELIDLDLTFRAHKPLLENLNTLLAPILGESDDPARPYAVPFAPLRAYRPKPIRENIQPPYIEFHLGLGENAEEGRFSAAQALSRRLRQLHEAEGFAWGDMALLFRSSTAYTIYEDALENANIPYITVAGRGFYDRPEIRDLLNALAAIADPNDDLALAGLLRSPAFAISDADIYRLRFPNPSSPQPAKLIDSLRASITNPLIPNSSFLIHAQRLSILTELHTLSSRAPAAAVLKHLLDLTNYRAILRAVPNGARMIRNVDKLLADAHRSRLVNLNDFLAYVQTLRDVGLREGEAPADSSSAGAVQLMTVHKAKGLEFPLTVLADASYEHRGAFGKIQLTPRGLLLDLKEEELHPTAWQLAAQLESDREDAEDARLLYVAATRAKEKLLISGYVKLKKDNTLSLAGWLGKLGAVIGLDEISLEMPALGAIPLKVTGISGMLYTASAESDSISHQPESTSQAESPRKSDLLESIIPTDPVSDEKIRARESDPPQRVWRVVSTLRAKRPRAPAWLVGRLVHEALRRWRFPDSDFENFMQPFALEAGLTDSAEIHAAIQESSRLLERLRAHSIFTEMDAAERHHEIRYDLPDGRGIIDLLYRTDAGWFIIDFKTDEARSDEEAQKRIREKGYDKQVARYAQAIENQLKVQAKMRLIFLNVKNSISIFDL